MSRLATIAAALTLCCATARAGDLNIGVILAGEITPGVYGQVMIGNNPPPLIYPQPVIIERVPYGVRPVPVYLHVPPGHARNWAKHCREYHACGRPVYFVRSAEYERYMREHGEREDNGRGHGHGQGQGHGHGHHDD